MKLTGNDNNDDVVDVRGQAPRGGAALKLGGGGVAVAIVALIVSRLFGIDVSSLLGGGSSTSSSTAPSSQGPGPAGQPAPHVGSAGDDEMMKFLRNTMADIQTTWDGLFKEQGQTYRHAKLYVFSSEIDTGCGRSSAEIGPFYCPADEKAYIDLTFYQDLRTRFGAPGDFAQAYVIAHEIGHHIQKLLGYEAKASRFRGNDPKLRNEGSVRLELQADCFAGVWGHSANQRKVLEMGDLEEALTAATAIGDDRLQKQAGVSVNSETWTHGSSEERVRWFKKGFESGRIDACDTFAATTL